MHLQAFVYIMDIIYSLITNKNRMTFLPESMQSYK